MFARKALVMVKMEATYGVDPVLAGVDAMLVTNLRVTPMQAQFVKRNLVRAYLGNDEELPAGVYEQIEFDVELQGSGVAATAPKWGRVMRACAMSETLTAADVTGAAAAATARSITLAAGASAVDGAYNGMQIDITAGPGTPATNVITSYVGATKVATVAKTYSVVPVVTTSSYAVRANSQYRPISAAMESVAFACNYDGTVHKALGARGSWSVKLNARGIPVLSFKLLGIYQTVLDTALLTPDYSAFQRPVIANSANTPVFYFFDTLPVVESFSIDIGNDAEYIQRIGSERVDMVDRAPVGKITFEATPVAFKDWWTVAKNATLDSLAVVHGASSGLRASFMAPNVQLKPPTYSEDKNVLMANADLVLIPGYLSGNDECTVTAF